MTFRRLAPTFAVLLAAAGVGLALPAARSHAAAKTAKTFDAGAERGEQIAARECARCHATDKTSPSPRASAPPFRDIRRRYNALSLSREFVTIGQVGHYEMPPTPISRSEGEDLIAFIESLGR
jgi:mono/diheme cytochrome c family protein